MPHLHHVMHNIMHACMHVCMYACTYHIILSVVYLLACGWRCPSTCPIIPRYAYILYIILYYILYIKAHTRMKCSHSLTRSCAPSHALPCLAFSPAVRCGGGCHRLHRGGNAQGAWLPATSCLLLPASTPIFNGKQAARSTVACSLRLAITARVTLDGLHGCSASSR